MKQTPSQTTGPFFHGGLIVAGDNILAEDEAKGRRVTLTGRVLDGEGVPVLDAVLEIWQADAEGIFKHSADPRQAEADPHFTGFGRAATEGGTYTFVTVKPGRSALDDETQAPYIRLRVFARGLLTHATTRVYFPDEANGEDAVLSAVPPTRRRTLIAELTAPATYRFDVHLQGENETVFFDR